MPQDATIRLGVLVERRATRSRWEPWTWRAVAIVPEHPDRGPWDKLRETDSEAVFHAATLPLTLHRDEATDYERNLRAPEPSIYVVSQCIEAEPDRPAIRPVRLTASPDEAQAYSEGAGHAIDPVPMPDWLSEWIGAFAHAHRTDMPVDERRHRGSLHFRNARMSGRQPVITAPAYRVPGRHE